MKSLDRSDPSRANKRIKIPRTETLPRKKSNPSQRGDARNALLSLSRLPLGSSPLMFRVYGKRDYRGKHNFSCLLSAPPGSPFLSRGPGFFQSSLSLSLSLFLSLFSARAIPMKRVTLPCTETLVRFAFVGETRSRRMTTIILEDSPVDFEERARAGSML